MKKISFMGLLCVGLSVASCSLGAKQHQLKVLNTQGEALGGIAIKAGYTGKDGNSVIFRGETDKNGFYSF